MKPVTDIHELFRHQRAIRDFTAEDVPDALVNQVLTAAIHAPSGSNTQPWHFIVIRDPHVKHAISEVYEEARAAAAVTRPSAGGVRQPLAAAPVLIVACVNIPASGQAGLQTGASIYPSVQNLMLAARALGLGTVLTTLHAVARSRSTPSSASPTISRVPRSSRSAGPTVPMVPTGGCRWSGL
jgi:nitroreductase